MTTASELTFGIEIETAMPRGVIAVGGYHSGCQVPQLPPGWRAERDCSIQCPAGHEPAEIVSPVIRGVDGVRQILAVCKWLNEVGAKVNRSTGFHVHVGWVGDDKALRRLVCLTSQYEKAIFASTGTHSREQSQFCRGVREDRCYQTNFKDGRGGDIGNRYHVLNLTNLGAYRKNTVEFRAFSGTTNATKVLGYVRLCLGIVEKALNSTQTPKWEPKNPSEKNSITRSGHGQTELARLFYRLGWTKGTSKQVYGEVLADDAPSLEEIKKELMRLARKYDGPEENNSQPILNSD
jgi:hypothetical protein